MVDDSILLAYAQRKLFCWVWESTAAWRSARFIRQTLAMAYCSNDSTTINTVIIIVVVHVISIICFNAAWFKYLTQVLYITGYLHVNLFVLYTVPAAEILNRRIAPLQCSYTGSKAKPKSKPIPNPNRIPHRKA